VQLGLVARIAHPGAAVRYDPKTRRHHHMICDRCGRVLDFESSALDALELPDVGSTGFELSGFTVHVSGVCAACRAAVRPG
jgi:Fur family peroxide stress response transcriptional regulator